MFLKRLWFMLAFVSFSELIGASNLGIRSIQPLSISVAFQPCHPDDDGHREILNWYLTDSEFLADRITHGTNGITMPQIQLVQDTDPECAVLDSFYASSRAMTYGGGSTDKLYMFTYYKAGSNLFVSRSIALSSDPDRYASGISTFSVHNSAGAFIKGYAF